MTEVQVKLGRAGIEKLKRGEVLREAIPGLPALLISAHEVPSVVVEVSTDDAGTVDGFEDEEA